MRDEAFEFQLGEEEIPTIESAVMQALGAASACWDSLPTGIFDSTRAKEIGDKLVAFIESKQPMLGYATTHDLIHELTARVDVAHTYGEEWPRYRTVDSE